jgi:hypothetical protein
METHFSRLLLVVAVALQLGACASEIAASDDEVCRSTGAKPGTPAYGTCLENMKEQRRIAQIENHRAMQRMQDMQQRAMRAPMPR